MDRKSIEVVAAVIYEEGRYLATQRGYGEFKGWWEFPGGKIEEGESRTEALSREIWEELNVDICINQFITTIEYDYPAFHLTMHCYLCHILHGKLELKEAQSAKWLSKGELHSVRWLPADIPVVETLLSSKHNILLKG